jgi:formate dehydrogenase major subunit
MGASNAFDFSTAEEIWNEVRTVWKAVAGISYARLDGGGLQWPCPTEDHAGTTVLHGESFSLGKEAALRRIVPRDPGEGVSDEFPFVLITGRTLYHFNAGTMTGRSRNTVLHPHDFLEISPDDASRLGIVSGVSVRIRSRHGETTLVARVNPEMRQGELFCTFHDAATFVNKVTSGAHDSVVDTPEYKVTAVRLSKPVDAQA